MLDVEEGPSGVPLLTDACIDWTADSVLKECKVSWQDGDCFPDFSSARTIMLSLQKQQALSSEHHAAAYGSLARLCAWLQSCSTGEMMLARYDAEGTAHALLEGSLLHHACKVISGVDHPIISKWKRQSKKQTTFADLLRQ